jgi:thiamine biosynthesis lipoprotein
LKVGWNGIHFAAGKLKKKEDQIEIDLAGIAKGYCVDMITNRLNEAGYGDVYVDWGYSMLDFVQKVNHLHRSEIRATGQHPDRRDWRTGIMTVCNG